MVSPERTRPSDPENTLKVRTLSKPYPPIFLCGGQSQTAQITRHRQNLLFMLRYKAALPVCSAGGSLAKAMAFQGVAYPLRPLPTRFKSLLELLLRLLCDPSPVLAAQPTLECLLRSQVYSRRPHPSLIPSR